MKKFILVLLLPLLFNGCATTQQNTINEPITNNREFLDHFKHTIAKGFCNAEGIQSCWNFEQNTSCSTQVAKQLDVCFHEILGEDLYTNTKQRIDKSQKHLLFCMMSPYMRKSNAPKIRTKEIACSKLRHSLMDWKINIFLPLLD